MNGSARNEVGSVARFPVPDAKTSFVLDSHSHWEVVVVSPTNCCWSQVSMFGMFVGNLTTLQAAQTQTFCSARAPSRCRGTNAHRSSGRKCGDTAYVSWQQSYSLIGCQAALTGQRHGITPGDGKDDPRVHD